jgi:hypothetical protein
VTVDAVRVLADRDQIHDVMMRYADGVDQRDVEAVRACFAPDLVTVGWGPRGDSFDRDALIRYISGVGHFRETMHMMGNQLIEVDGDRAAMDTFATLTHRLDGDPEKLLVSSRYVEKLARRDGEWVITQRGGDAVWAPTGVDRITSDDPAVQWLLDRAAVRDAIVRTTVEAELRADAPVRNFLGSRLVDVDGDEAVADSYALVTPFDAGGDRARPSAVITPQRWSHRCARLDGRWQVVGHVVDGPDLVADLPAVPASDDPRVRALLDRAAVLDVVVHAARVADRRDGGARHWSFANNHLVAVAGDGASVQSYVFEIDQPAGATEPTSWTDGARRHLDSLRREAGSTWRLVRGEVADNVMPDDKVIVRPGGEQSIEALTRRAQELARESE